MCIDLSGKLPGRGAYLHDRKSCWSDGLKGRLEKALRTTIQEQNKAVLQSFMETLDDNDVEDFLEDSSETDQNHA